MMNNPAISPQASASGSADSMYVCESVADLYNERGRALIAQICRDHLEENKLIPLELLSNSGQARLIMEAGEMQFAGLIQKVAVGQSQAVRQTGGVAGKVAPGSLLRERSLFLMKLCASGLEQLIAIEKALPPAPLDAATLDQLAAASDRRPAYAALARHLTLTASWTDKAERCFNLIGPPDRPSAPAQALMALDLALAEILLIRTAVPELLGKAQSPAHRLRQLLSLLDKRYALSEGEPVTEPAQKLGALMLNTPMPALRFAVLQLIRRLLDTGVPLVSDEPGAEFRATREIYDLLHQDATLPMALQADMLIEQRMRRLVTRENLARLIAGAFSAPKLMQALLLLEQAVGPSPRDILQKYAFYLLEHRDLDKDFTDPTSSQAEKLEMANALREQAAKHGLVSEHRRERMLELIDALIGRLKASEQRRAPRTMCGPEDHVVLEGMKANLRNWSAIGLLFGPCSAQVQAGQQLRLTVRIKNPKIMLGFDAEAEVVRAGEDGMIAVKYRALDRQIAKTIATYFDPVGAARH
ncbi:hypothetical protein [Ferrovibrio sp.]|uniref:hypothetical protein n=1 Tax=Ferrovibrio sp. TaxID=1917215 RepID=UPI0025C5A41E|nr:hypothetical protein [Ferrovibrio sp.]